MSVSQQANSVSEAPSTDHQSLSVPATAASDVVLLIDWENLKWSLKHKFQAEPNISSLVEAAKEYGRLVTARAYADWTQPS